MAIKNIERTCQILGCIEVIIIEEGEYLASSILDAGVLSGRPALGVSAPGPRSGHDRGPGFVGRSMVPASP